MLNIKLLLTDHGVPTARGLAGATRRTAAETKVGFRWSLQLHWVFWYDVDISPEVMEAFHQDEKFKNCFFFSLHVAFQIQGDQKRCVPMKISIVTLIKKLFISNYNHTW